MKGKRDAAELVRISPACENVISQVLMLRKNNISIEKSRIQSMFTNDKEDKVAKSKLKRD